MSRTAPTSACRIGGLDVDDDRVVQIDQIVGAVGEEGPVTVGSGKPCRGIGRRDRLRLYRRGCAESGVVERVEVFLRCSACPIFR
jgi:hypothetical protein